MENFVTKDYFEKKLDENTNKILTEIKQYNKDLMSGFQDKIYGMGDYVKGIEERVVKLEERV